LIYIEFVHQEWRKLVHGLLDGKFEPNLRVLCIKVWARDDPESNPHTSYKNVRTVKKSIIKRFFDFDINGCCRLNIKNGNLIIHLNNKGINSRIVSFNFMVKNSDTKYSKDCPGPSNCVWNCKNIIFWVHFKSENSQY